MSNVHGLYSNKKKKKDEDNDDEEEPDESNNRYVGGIGDRGGGSGLAVLPNADEIQTGPPRIAIPDPDSIFQLASDATSEDQSQVRRTITMYRDGFVVDDGPYRRLDDKENAAFLNALAMGMTPKELQEDNPPNVGVVVGLVDKRSEEYVEEFRSFSGQGTSLGRTTAAPTDDANNTVFDPAVLLLAAAPPAAAAAAASSTTAIQVRLENGQRRVVRLPLTATVRALAAQVVTDHHHSDGPFQLLFGFPPRPLAAGATIQDAGLKGAQVSLQKV